MVNPVTVNLGIIVPLTGADVDTWGEDDVNPNMVALDGLLAGVQTIGVTNVDITLTGPAGFAATPSPGPNQSQNRVLRFTGVMIGNVRITLPLPGSYLIDNRTTGAFVLSFQGVTATEVVAVDQGCIVEIYNDGANVRFVNLGNPGDLKFLAGVSQMPAWITACTKLPYLPADGTNATYNFTDYPWLGARMQGTFGGNGITTFGIPDCGGRIPLAYDRSGTRITVAGCGINGQTLGAVLDKQTNILVTANLPPYTPSGTLIVGGITFPNVDNTSAANGAAGSIATGSVTGSTADLTGRLKPLQAPSSWTGIAQGGASTPVNNVQPVQVAGMWVIKT